MKRKKPLKRGASKQSSRTKLRVWGPPLYRTFIESFGCDIWDCNYHPVDAHHVKPRSQGGTYKDLVPLCREHHNQWHTDKAFRDNTTEELENTASYLYEQFTKLHGDKTSEQA